MNRETLKTIKNSNGIMRCTYNFIVGLHAWFLNYIVSMIPFWCVRRFFYILSGMRIGKGSRIGLHTRVVRPGRISIGQRSIINEHCYLDGRGGLTIADDCSISIYTKIITASHKADSFAYYEKPVVIEDHVWIGCNAIVLDGSYLARGCIIGAGAVVKKETEKMGIYAGNPIKHIKTRESDLSYYLDYHPFFK